MSLSELIEKFEAAKQRMAEVPLGIFATPAAWELLKAKCADSRIEDSIVYGSLNGMPVWVCDLPEVDGPREMFKHERDVIVATIEDGKLVARHWSYKSSLRQAYMVGGF